MRVRLVALLCAAVLGGCDSPSFPPPPSPTELAFKPAGASDRASENCPSGYECVEPQLIGGVTPDLAQLEFNCGMEGCGLNTPTATGVDFDASGWYDRVNFDCSGASPGSVLSSYGCWDCAMNCGGSSVEANCPSGKDCVSVTIPGSEGSDCKEYRCDASQNYEAFTYATFVAPLCKRPASSPPGTPSVTASINSGNPYLSWSAVSGATSYNIYRKLEWQGSYELWGSTSNDYYQDSYAPVNSVLSSPSGNYLTYYVVAVNGAGSSNPSASKYYSYTPPIPY